MVEMNLKNHNAKRDVDRVPLGNGTMGLKCFGTQHTKHVNGRFVHICAIFVFIQRNMMISILLFM